MTTSNIEEYRAKLKGIKILNLNLHDFLGIVAMIIMIISFTIQIRKLISTKDASDYSLWFILLQLVGSPEGGGGMIGGALISNYKLMVSGAYGFIYYCVALYYFLNKKKTKTKNKN